MISPTPSIRFSYQRPEITPLLICAIKSSVFAVEPKKHKEIEIEDFKGLSDDQLNTLTNGARFLFSRPDPSNAAPKSKPKCKPVGKWPGGAVQP